MILEKSCYQCNSDFYTANDNLAIGSEFSRCRSNCINFNTNIYSLIVNLRPDNIWVFKGNRIRNSSFIQSFKFNIAIETNFLEINNYNKLAMDKIMFKFKQLAILE